MGTTTGDVGLRTVIDDGSLRRGRRRRTRTGDDDGASDDDRRGGCERRPTTESDGANEPRQRRRRRRTTSLVDRLRLGTEPLVGNLCQLSEAKEVYQKNDPRVGKLQVDSKLIFIDFH